jgi:hypothetical protein
MSPYEVQDLWCFTVWSKDIHMQSKGKLKRSDLIASIFLWFLGICIVVSVILLLRGCE